MEIAKLDLELKIFENEKTKKFVEDYKEILMILINI